MNDEAQITALLIRYATGIDRRDWPLFATCFTADVFAEYGDFGGNHHDRAAFVASFEKGHAQLGPTLHRMSNIAIAVAGDTATARTYVDAILMRDAPRTIFCQAIGYYDDSLIREPSGWKIRHRKFTSVHFIPGPP